MVRLREEYRQRRDTMLEGLAREFSEGATWTRPQGGMFVWMRLSPEIDSARSSRTPWNGVAFVPGGEFQVDGGRACTLRLNFTHAAPVRLAEGVARLGDAVRSLGRSGS